LYQKYDVLTELEEFINEFNQNNNEDFNIDSIRIDFDKQYHKEKLYQLGEWKQLLKNSNILHKLKKRLKDNEVTSVFRLEKYNIYYYNKKDTSKKNKKYRKATLVIFGMQQYDKEPPPKILTQQIVSILKNVSNIDLCLDIPFKPNIQALERLFDLTPYFDSRYVNYTGIVMLDKILVYNKAFKNSLGGTLWRIEAKISIPSIKYLALPLYEFKEITDLLKDNR